MTKRVQVAAPGARAFIGIHLKSDALAGPSTHCHALSVPESLVHAVVWADSSVNACGMLLGTGDVIWAVGEVAVGIAHTHDEWHVPAQELWKKPDP